ncbi:MAG: substrate-binding domain-containing protein, partial [Acidimicrobiia bacterium]
MTANKRRSRVLGPLVVVALILAACGGDSGDTTTTAGEATTTAAEATTTVAAETTTSAGDTTTSAAAAGEAVEITAGDSITATFLPKCTNIAVFPQANSGAEEAAAELGSDPAEFVGPADCGDTTGQIEFMTNAVTQGVDAIMLSNNSGDQLDAPAQAAADAGIPVVTWDSPIPSATGESVFVAQVDFDETGQVMAEMARTILGDDGGEFAILSATPDAANQNAWIAAMEEVLATPEFENLVLVETVYG